MLCEVCRAWQESRFMLQRSCKQTRQRKNFTGCRLSRNLNNNCWSFGTWKCEASFSISDCKGDTYYITNVCAHAEYMVDWWQTQSELQASRSKKVSWWMFHTIRIIQWTIRLKQFLLCQASAVWKLDSTIYEYQVKHLRRIPCKVRAISEKIIYKKSPHSTVTS